MQLPVWQLEALADAAQVESDECIARGESHAMSYLQGIRAALRVLSGTADPREMSPTFTAVYERYLDSV